MEGSGCFISYLCLLAVLARNVVAVNILDINTPRREKECYGSHMKFSFSGTHEFHYESLRRRYTGCTYVQGNLEITNLDNTNVTYDLSFLSHIRVVTGYVLLGLLNVETIPLTRLSYIRGDNTINLSGVEYGLVVALTSGGTPTVDNPLPGLKVLQLPRLREISRGGVLFTRNPLLCHVDTVAWDLIVAADVVEVQDGGLKDHCKPCPAECKDEEGVARCWGASRHLCQRAKRIKCDPACPGRCHKEGILGCCHPECAIGCSGGMNTECEMCKYFRYGERCVPSCPDNTYPLSQECIDF